MMRIMSWHALPEQSAVLLKNDDNILPLKEEIAIAGNMAGNMRYRGFRIKPH